MLNDLDAVAEEWSLSEQEKDAVKAIASVGSSTRVSDNAAVLIAAGAHPLRRLCHLHAVHGEFRNFKEKEEGMSRLKGRIAVVRRRGRHW
jgi:hypothetical protein